MMIPEQSALDVVIVDDEEISRLLLREYCERSTEIRVVGEFESTAAATEFLDSQRVDLILLDVELPGMTGLELAAQIGDKIQVVMTMSNGSHARGSADVATTDFLEKPIEFDRFRNVVSRARLRQHEATESRSDSRIDHVMLKADGCVHRVPYARIQYIEAQGDYLSVKTDDRNYFVHGTMKAMNASLPTSDFIRIHRSYVVRRDRIERIRASSLEVAGSKLPIGVTYKSAVRLTLNPPPL